MPREDRVDTAADERRGPQHGHEQPRVSAWCLGSKPLDLEEVSKPAAVGGCPQLGVL